MEFCPQLSAFQGVIISADNVHPFSRLSSRGGNEEKIQYVVDNISKFLEDGKYSTKDALIDDTINTVRKFALFIILNSDLSVLSDMTDMEEVELVIWTIPTIPKCLMCELFWRLHFDKFVYEAIAYCDPELALEIASAFIENIKYYTPSECFNKISIITSALFKLICRIYFFNFYSNILTDKLDMMFSHFQKALNFFIEPPKQETLNTLNKDDQYKYIGKCLNTMLLLVMECFQESMCSQELDGISDPVYTLTYIGSVTRNLAITPCECASPEILDCINKCHTTLLDKCQELVMGVSVDIFCAWSEFEENGKSIQRKIGELCHKVRIKLLSISSVAEHPVIGMLQQISCKPEDLNDIIKNADADTIVQNINNSGEDKALWLKALVKKDQVYKNETFVNCISNNLQVLNAEDCYKIYKSVKNFIIHSSDYEDHLDVFIIKLFQHCALDVKYKILNKCFSDNRFTDLAETCEFLDAQTETFNKLIATPDADLTDILSLFLQNPFRVYTTIYKLAAENTQQASIMLKAMKLLERFSNHYYDCDTEPCIIRVAQKRFEKLDSEAKKNNFIKFLCDLKNANIITGTKLLILIIMPHIHKALIKKDIISLHVQCQLLKDAFTLEELIVYRAPMLAMLGQIMDTVRWKIITYSVHAPAALHLTLEIQIMLFNTYESGIPDNESNWLRNRLRCLQPLNMYYFRKLWNPPGNNFVEIISGLNINADVNMEELITWLTQVVCACTVPEWFELWDGLTALGDCKALEAFNNAIMLLSIAETYNSTAATWACVLNCYRNFVYTIRYKYLRDHINDNQVANVVEKFTVMLNLTSEERVDELSLVLIPLFIHLADKKNDYCFDVAQYLREHMTNFNVTELLTNLFTSDLN